MPRRLKPGPRSYKETVKFLDALAEKMHAAWASKDNGPKYEAATDLWWTWKEWRGDMPLGEAIAAQAWRKRINLRRDGGAMDDRRIVLRALVSVTLEGQSPRTPSTVTAALANLALRKSPESVLQTLTEDGFERTARPNLGK